MKTTSKYIFTGILALSVSSLTAVTAFSHGSETHDKPMAKKMMNMKMDMGMKMDGNSIKKASVQNKNTAFEALVQGIDVMEKTGSNKYIKEMLSGGAVMNEWHVTTESIYDAIEVLENYAETLSGDKKDNLEKTLEDFSDTLDTFHMVTHDKEAKDAQLAIHSKVKEARSILEKLKANIQ